MPRDTSELAERVRRAIARAELRTGDRLGSERQLADDFGVPRSALREALEELESSGVIRRTMGRTGGVFVSDGKIERQLNTIVGVPDMLRQQGYTSATTVLEKGIGLASPAEARNLALAEGDNVFRMRRLRLADGFPLSIDTMVLPMRLLPGFQDHDHSGSVYRLLASEYRIDMHQADETIDLALATPTQASLLRIDVGAPLFEIWRVTLDASETPVEFSHDFFRADRTRISLRRYGSRWKRAVTPAR